MQRVLLVAEKNDPSYRNPMIECITAGLHRHDVEVVALLGNRDERLGSHPAKILAENDSHAFADSEGEHRFSIALDVAQEQKVDRILFADLAPPQDLCAAMESRPALALMDFDLFSGREGALPGEVKTDERQPDAHRAAAHREGMVYAERAMM